ncbi:Fatty-acid amide hydrolase 2-A [Nymphon striatum]|nr:Fatty-acid amide hydrolase 2-A [Nymphon striatum]
MHESCESSLISKTRDGVVQVKMSYKYFLAKFVKLIFQFIEIITDIVFGWIYKDRNIRLPPITNSILLESATSLAKKIRTKKVKSKDVVQAFVSRIEEINPILNCVIDTCFDEALRKAQEVDEMIESGEVKEEDIAKDTPFLGVPFTTKDSLAVKGTEFLFLNQIQLGLLQNAQERMFFPINRTNKTYKDHNYAMHTIKHGA